jgi:hypothetical protein
MMIDINRLREIVASENQVTAATVVLIADHLLTWWRAVEQLRTFGEVIGGKLSPWVGVKREAARVLWDRRSRYVLDGAVKYLEENHGVAERDGKEKGVGGHEVPGNVCAVDLRGRGVVEVVDRGSAVDVPRLGGDQGPHRKGYKRKVPARLRT